MNEREFAELSAGHALHALSIDDERSYQDALARHPQWERTVLIDSATAFRLSESIAGVAPPTSIRASLLAQIAQTPQVSGSPAAVVSAEPLVVDAAEAEAAPATSAETRRTRADARRRGRGMRTWFALAASLVLLVGVGFTAVFVGQQLNRPAAVVALDQIESASDAQSSTVTLSDGGEATAHWSGSLGQAVLVTDGLPAITSDQSYELWFVRGDGTPVSAGVFSSADGNSTTLLDGTIKTGDTIALTVEKAGGSKSGLPTSKPIVAISTA